MDLNLKLCVVVCVYLILNLSMYYFLSPSKFPLVIRDIIGMSVIAVLTSTFLIGSYKLTGYLLNKYKESN